MIEKQNIAGKPAGHKSFTLSKLRIYFAKNLSTFLTIINCNFQKIFKKLRKLTNLTTNDLKSIDYVPYFGKVAKVFSKGLCAEE